MDEIIIISPAFTMNSAPHWVAIDKGFFKEEGIQVSLEYILGKKPAEQWNLPQDKDKLVFRSPGSSQPFRAAKVGVHLVNIICVQEGPGHDMIARPEIKSIVDLKGKRIIAGAGPSHLDAVVMLKRFGLDPDKDVVWVSSEEKPPDTERYRVESIIRGEVDAMASGPPHWAMGVKMGLNRLPSARDFEIRPTGGLATSPEIIKERPDLVLRVVRAVIKGTEFARLNKEETLDIVQRHIIYTNRDTLSYCWDSIHNQWYVRAEEEPYIEMAKAMEKEYKVPHKPLEYYYNFSFIRKAMEELRLFRRPLKS